jgi:LmbE family N-acetylglucosaminyl deacetylase
MSIVLAVGAHYDDIEIGVGGTLIKHIDKGDTVFLAILEGDDPRTGDPSIRYQEQLCVLGKLGLSEKNLLIFKSDYHEPDVVSVLDSIQPTFIYAPYEKDTHYAHRRASMVAQGVGRKKQIATLFFHCGSTLEFHPNVFSIVDYNKKKTLIECHKSQLDHGAVSLDIRYRMESYWGSLISYEPDTYAEGFITRKMMLSI